VVVFSEKARRVEMTVMGTSNIQHSTFNTQGMPNAKHWMLGVGCWMLDVLKLILAPLLAFQLLATNALAAEKLSADLIPLGLRARSAAPITVEARFKWDSTRILEGRLEMEFLEGNQVLGRYRSGELALTGGEQTFRMLLPPSVAPFSDSQMQVQMKFVTAGNAIEMEPSTLFVPTASERSLVVGWCDAGTTAGWQRRAIEQNLLFERFAPAADNLSQRLLMTSVVRLDPEDLPVQPLAYTSFDVVVLTAEAFKQANERQLQALARWVKGGGSACVYVGGGLQPHHIEFLNQLAEATSGGPTFLSDDAGNLLPAQKDILSLRSGLGRSVIVPEDIVADLNSNAPACRQAAAFLWKVRSNRMQAIVDSGHWEVPANPSMRNNSFSRVPQPVPPPIGPGVIQNGRQFAGSLSYSILPTYLGAELMNLLMPRTVRLIPFSALLGLLGLFLLIIGPADYFVLGFLRRRRWTWVLFPATSIAFTVATVLMANHYLGLRDQRRSLIVVDLARDGTALRWNRYELIFAARDKQSVTELKDALWTPLKVQALMPGQAYGLPGQASVRVINGRQVLILPNNMAPNYPGAISSAGAQGETEPPLYDGVLPVHFQTSEAIRQWQPVLNRTFSFEPPPVPLFPNWRAIEEAWPNLQNIRAKLSEKKSFNGDLFVISRSNSITADSGSAGILPPSILEELSTGDSRGLLSLVSQVSPTGGGNFEDVQAMDAEANDSVLAIVTRIGDDIVVYRRIFHGN
jgi:hypothetical protein